jgi:5-methylcytosine-specific restriction endonuclease McrA
VTHILRTFSSHIVSLLSSQTRTPSDSQAEDIIRPHCQYCLFKWQKFDAFTSYYNFFQVCRIKSQMVFLTSVPWKSHYITSQSQADWNHTTYILTPGPLVIESKTIASLTSCTLCQLCASQNFNTTYMILESLNFSSFPVHNSSYMNEHFRTNLLHTFKVINYSLCTVGSKCGKLSPIIHNVASTHI